MSPQRGWEYLKGLEYGIKVPRPAHDKSDPQTQQEWKKKLAIRVEQVKQETGKSVRVWAMDEHRIGLKPMVRRAWFPWWEVPIAPVNWRFEWCWVYGFVEANSGETEWWVFNRVDTAVMNAVLADFARVQKIEPENPGILVLDQARWHTTQKLVIPEGLTLEFLPAYSPELQPAERLWGVLDEVVVNRVFESLEELMDTVCQRCCQLSEQKQRIQRLTQFHWWPTLDICTV